MTRIFRWNGEYFGFITNQRFFDANSNYLGWVDDDGSVWKRDGHFLGEIVDENYVLRRHTMTEPAVRAQRAAPATPPTPAYPANRASRAQRAGWFDPLDQV